MKFKSFLILSSTFILTMAAGCSTSPTKSAESKSPEKTNSLSDVFLGTLKALYSPSSSRQSTTQNSIANYYSGGTSGWVGSLANISKDETRDSQGYTNMAEWHQQFCQNGKPIKRYAYSIRAVVPNPPKGMIVTEASAYRTAWIRAIEDAAGTILLSGMDIPKVRKPYPNEALQAKVAAIKSRNESQIIQDYKENSYLANSRWIEPPTARSLMFLMPSESSKIFLVPRRAMLLTGNPYDYRAELFEVPLHRPIHQRSTLPPVYLAQREIRVYIERQSTTISPISAATLTEMSIMSSQYVLLIPEEEQTKFGLRKYIPNDIKYVVSHRQNIFADMVSKMTTLKEAQSEDPGIIDYEISLDLSLFCAYSRPLSDFISH